MSLYWLPHVIGAESLDSWPIRRLVLWTLPILSMHVLALAALNPGETQHAFMPSTPWVLIAYWVTDRRHYRK